MLANLERYVESTQYYHAEPRAYNYENFVVTVRLVPEDYSLALESILAHHYGGFVKCGLKRRICKILFRLNHSVGTTTHLLFRSGKMNTVGAKSVEHARYGAHCIRIYIARIKGLYLYNGRLLHTDLQAQTIFGNFAIQLMTASATLSKSPNLRHLVSIAPDLARWSPKEFSGLILLVWVRPKNKCKCPPGKKLKANNCNCTVTMLLFSSGKVVITGCKRLSDVPRAVQLIEQLFQDDCQFGTHEVEFKGFKDKPVQKADREFDPLALVPNKKKRT